MPPAELPRPGGCPGNRGPARRRPAGGIPARSARTLYTIPVLPFFRSVLVARHQFSTLLPAVATGATVGLGLHNAHSGHAQFLALLAEPQR